MPSSRTHPKLRPVEVIPVQEDGQRLLVIHDPAGLAEGSAAMAPATMFVLGLMDGEHSLEAIQQKFTAQFDAPLPGEQLEQLIEQLDEAHYLDSENFTSYFASLVADYRSAPARVSSEDLASLGIRDGGLVPAIERMLNVARDTSTEYSDRRLAGLIVPHLDFVRGTPCYADGYQALSLVSPVDRYVILGTNHFGRGTSVVATGKDFQTPLGTARTDKAFLAEFESRLDVDLCEHEFDHKGEHSIELQVLILQYLAAGSDFEIVPILCPDVCGPNGTVPADGKGVDLDVLGETLGALIAEDKKSTLIIAGADLSHVGMRFGDERELDDKFLDEVEQIDRNVLGTVVAGDRDGFVEGLVAHQNSTRVCSAGSIYILMSAVGDGKAELIRYHQAVDKPSQTCVTCCAMA
ncbi:MAG: AmmeMemoRadiSam system protein B, partial [Planctomycetota bacterium]